MARLLQRNQPLKHNFYENVTLYQKGLSHQQIAEQAALRWESMSIMEHLQMYIDQGMDKKSATKQVALDRNIPKREVYDVATGI